jgi:hypothetical protein
MRVSALVALALASAACSGDGVDLEPGCAMLCVSDDACPSAIMIRCIHACETGNDLNADSGCTVQRNDVLLCMGSQSGGCSACASEVSAYQACIDTYCALTPRPPACDVAG